MLHTLWPRAVDRTDVICEWYFEPETIEVDGFDPSDAIDFWDQVNREDWRVCELTQKGVRARGYVAGRYSADEGDVHAFDAMVAERYMEALRARAEVRACPPWPQKPPTGSSTQPARSSPRRGSTRSGSRASRREPGRRAASSTTTSRPAKSSSSRRSSTRSSARATTASATSPTRGPASATETFGLAIRECLPFPGESEREWVLWVELWLRAVREPGLRRGRGRAL